MASVSGAATASREFLRREEIVQIPVALVTACVLGLVAASNPAAGLGTAALVIAFLVIRRWSWAIWVITLAPSLLFYDFLRTTPVVHFGTTLYLSDALFVFLFVYALSGPLHTIDLSPSVTRGLIAMTVFVVILMVGVERTISKSGTTAALQAKDLLPFALVPLLAVNRRFARLSSERVVDVLAIALIAVGVRSLVRLGLGIETTTALGQQRIYQTWEPFIASGIALTVLGFIVIRGRGSALHWTGLLLGLLPVIFSFFRTAWVLLAACAIMMFAIAPGRAHRLALVSTIIALTLGAGAVYSSLTPSKGGTSYLEQVTSRANKIGTTLDPYRQQELGAVWLEIKKSPWVGSGFGTQYGGTFTNVRAFSHNAYEWLWWRLGLLGLIAFLAALGFVLAAGIRAYRQGPAPDQALAFGLMGAVAFTMLAANLHENFENIQTNFYVALVLGQLMSLSARIDRPHA